MQVIYHLYDGKYEIEGMFSQQGNIIGCWSLNDACWRNEYFEGFLNELGYQVSKPPKHLKKAMLHQLREALDCLDD